MKLYDISDVFFINDCEFTIISRKDLKSMILYNCLVKDMNEDNQSEQIFKQLYLSKHSKYLDSKYTAQRYSVNGNCYGVAPNHSTWEFINYIDTDLVLHIDDKENIDNILLENGGSSYILALMIENQLNTNLLAYFITSYTRNI